MLRHQLSLRSICTRLLDWLLFPYSVLCVQFLFRIVDLESLALEADIPRF